MRDSFVVPPQFGPDPRSPRRLALIEDGIERAIVVDGIRFNYQDHGRGPAVVLIHGVAGSASDWAALVGPLVEAGFRALCVETRGAGYSDRPLPGDYSVWALARELAKLLRRLHVSGATVVGNSLGGAIALALARKAPRLVSRLVLLDAVAYGSSMPLIVSGLRIPAVPGFLARMMPPRALIAFVLSCLGGDASWVRKEVVSEYAHELALPNRMLAMFEMLRCVVRADAAPFEAEIARVEQPTLVVWGERDPVFPVSIGERLHGDIAGSRLVVIPGCGHMPNLEAPSAVLEALLRFLRRETGSRRRAATS